MASHRILLSDEDLQFIKDYKEAFGLSIQDFVREAVADKISLIRLNEDLKDLQRLKK
jgi:predicted DNA binding CopG/RHH family protein